MSCNRFQEELLVAYLFGEATEEEKAEVEEHLDSCEGCAAALAELRGTVSTMKAWKDEELPRKVVLLPGRKEAARPGFSAPVWLKGLGWAAAAALVALVITQGSIQYGKGSLMVSFGRDGRPEIASSTEEGRSTQTPTEVALSTSDSSSSTPRRTALPPARSGVEHAAGIRYASMEDLERAQRQNLAIVNQLLRASEKRRAEQWTQGMEYLLTTVNNQRRRDLSEIMMRIDAIGTGAMDGIQMTNFRLDELANTVGTSGAQGQGRPVRLTPEQIRRMQEREDD